MSIQAYLEPRGRRLSGLTVFPAGGVGGGISSEGPVLGGRMSLEEALLLDRIQGGLGERGCRVKGQCEPPDSLVRDRERERRRVG